jgi:hypothetical protein
MWTGGNALGVAARHHDSTKHATWCDVHMSVRYGEQTPDPRQTDIEDAIRALSGSMSTASAVPPQELPEVSA